MKILRCGEKVAEDASPRYTCYVSRMTVQKNTSNLYQMLKKPKIRIQGDK